MPSGVYSRPIKGQEQQEMINKKFSRLLVLHYDPIISKQRGRDYYLCRCVCRTEKIISGGNLRNGRLKSCGCLRQENMSKIGKGTKNGENHPAYIDGRWIQQQKLYESIRERDNYTCQNCGKTQKDELKSSNRKLSIHHKDGDHFNDVPENMVTLCGTCHPNENAKNKEKTNANL